MPSLPAYNAACHTPTNTKDLSHAQTATVCWCSLTSKWKRQTPQRRLPHLRTHAAGKVRSQRGSSIELSTWPCGCKSCAWPGFVGPSGLCILFLRKLSFLGKSVVYNSTESLARRQRSVQDVCAQLSPESTSASCVLMQQAQPEPKC